VEDPEIQKPELNGADKSEKPEEGEGPRAAALAEAEAVPETKSIETIPKAQDNPNSPDCADEENLSKPQDPPTKVVASMKEVEDPNASIKAVASIESAEAEAAMISTSAPDHHTGKKLAIPGGELATKSVSASPRDGGEGSHHVWMSMRELQDHHGHDKDGNGGEECKHVRTGGSKECPGAAKMPSSTSEGKGTEPDEAEEPEKKGFSCPDPLSKLWELIMPSPEKYWLLFFASITFIALCTYLMVDAVNRTGCNLNVEPLIMGLIFLAAGTSVPDALGSIAVAKQGEGDMAVANAFGSNVFDILLGLGLPWFLSTACMQREVVFPGAGGQLLEWILILTVILVLFVGALAYNKMRLNQTMGGILMTLYLVYVVIALVRALAFK